MGMLSRKGDHEGRGVRSRRQDARRRRNMESVDEMEPQVEVKGDCAMQAQHGPDRLGLDRTGERDP